MSFKATISAHLLIYKNFILKKKNKYIVIRINVNGVNLPMRLTASRALQLLDYILMVNDRNSDPDIPPFLDSRKVFELLN